MPKGILKPEKMQQVMWDMISAGEYLTGFVLTKDSLDKYAESAKVYSQVLQIHKISVQDFEKSYLYYRQHPELMAAIVDSLGKRRIDVPAETPPAETPSMITDKEREAADTVRNLDSLTRTMMDSLKARRDSMRKRVKKFKAIP